MRTFGLVLVACSVLWSGAAHAGSSARDGAARKDGKASARAKKARKDKQSKKPKKAAKPTVGASRSSGARRNGDELIDALDPVLRDVWLDQRDGQVTVVASSPEVEAKVRKILSTAPGVTVKRSGIYLASGYRETESYVMDRTHPFGGTQKVEVSVRQEGRVILN